MGVGSVRADLRPPRGVRASSRNLDADLLGQHAEGRRRVMSEHVAHTDDHRSFVVQELNVSAVLLLYAVAVRFGLCISGVRLARKDSRKANRCLPAEAVCNPTRIARFPESYLIGLLCDERFSCEIALRFAPRARDNTARPVRALDFGLYAGFPIAALSRRCVVLRPETEARDRRGCDRKPNSDQPIARRPLHPAIVAQEPA